MNAPTAAFSAQSGLLPHAQLRSTSLLPYLALVALATATLPSGVGSMAAAPPALPSAFVPEAGLYQLGSTQRSVRHVTAEESRILRLAILASSEIIDEGTLSDA
jgi:hypothetical protein